MKEIPVKNIKYIQAHFIDTVIGNSLPNREAKQCQEACKLGTTVSNFLFCIRKGNS